MERYTIELVAIPSELSIVFSGFACMATPEAAFLDSMHNAMKIFNEVAAMRYDAAVSGAMRWPESQEAAIGMNAQLRLL